jgi:hypothetical protein
MSSPIELLREAILQGDWSKACQSFEGLTGMRLDPPETSAGTAEVEVRIDQAALAATLKEAVAQAVRENMRFEQAVDEPPRQRPDPPRLPRREEPLTKQFQVQHRGSKGGKACRAMPFNVGEHHNTWKDDGKLAAEEIAGSRKLSATKAPEPRREPTGLVRVECCKCNREEDVLPIFAPRSLDSGDRSSYVCNDCIKSPGN